MNCGQTGRLVHVNSVSTGSWPQVPCKTVVCVRTVSAAAQSSNSSNGCRQQLSKRQQQLLQVGLEEGWGVLAVETPSPHSIPNQGASGSCSQTVQPTEAHAAKKAKSAPRALVLSRKPRQRVKPDVKADAEAQDVGSERALSASPSSSSGQGLGPSLRKAARTQKGMVGLFLMQQQLLIEGGSPLAPQQVSELTHKGVAFNRGAGMAQGRGHHSRAAARQGRWAAQEDVSELVSGKEGGGHDLGSTPAFSLTLGKDGLELGDIDTVASAKQAATADKGLVQQRMDVSGIETEGEGAMASSRSVAKQDKASQDQRLLIGGQAGRAGKMGVGVGAVEEGEDKDGDEIQGGRSQKLGLLGLKARHKAGGLIKAPQVEMGDEEEDEEDEEGNEGGLGPTLWEQGSSVTWGGSGSGASEGFGTGVDLEEQEEVLHTIFKPHKVSEFMEFQRAALQAAADLKKRRMVRGGGAFGAEAKLHQQLRIIGGSAANVRLVSSQGSTTRPMMEKVRTAIFNMVLAQAGSGSSLPPNSRWLDLYAGTGSVGLEALSRGAGSMHAVEADAWVVRNVLGRNLERCGFQRKTIVHTSKVEAFLRKAADIPRFAGGPFDFISLCPPYLLVSYPELFSLLHTSPLIHDRTIMFVEYPKQLASEVPDTVGPLAKVRDRKYGRTWVAVYAPAGSGEEFDEDVQ